MNVYKLKPSNRACYAFPWESQKVPCPWDRSQYERVVIPFSEKEKINSAKRVHIQVVRRNKLELVKQPKMF